MIYCVRHAVGILTRTTLRIIRGVYAHEHPALHLDRTAAQWRRVRRCDMIPRDVVYRSAFCVRRERKATAPETTTLRALGVRFLE